MKKLLNTVYVTTEGAALKKDGENLVAEIEGAQKSRVPLHMLASVLTSRRTPLPTPHRSRCRACSLLELCRPDAVSRSARQWRDRMLAKVLE